jgi:predicted metal-binding protein
MSLPNYKCHLFICTNTKDKGESCGPKESGALRLELKKRLEEKYPDLRPYFRINASGCLGQCEKGIAAVCYPAGEWQTHLELKDIEKLEVWALGQLQSQ